MKEGEFFKEPITDNLDAELFKFFENHGYTNLKRPAFKGINDILLAEKDGKECFIKKFKDHPQLASGAERADNELACYANLPKELLIDVVESNAGEHYIVLEKADLQDLGIDEHFIAASLEMGLDKFSQIEATFLPEINWEHYEKLFDKIKEIGKAGLMDDADAIVDVFKNRKELIENAKKGFSHQDFSHRNIKKIGDKIKIFDFEYSRRDNAMYDMTTIYFDIKDDAELTQLFQEKLSQSELYDKELFDLMLIRRSAFIVFNFLTKNTDGSAMNNFVRKNLEILQKTARTILEKN